MRMGLALFGGEERQDGRERIDREALAFREMKHLAAQFEIVAGLGPAIEPGGAQRRYHLDLEIIELEAVIWKRGHRCPRAGGRVPGMITAAGLGTIGRAHV